jgi:hypothetical protein
MKRTRRAKKNKSIKVKRRLGGSMYTRRQTPGKLSNDQYQQQLIQNIGNNSKKSRRSHTNKQTPSLPPSSHTTWTNNPRIPAGKLLSVAALAALGSIIPVSEAALTRMPRTEWLPLAEKCVGHSGYWDASNQKCTNHKSEPSADLTMVNKAIACVKADGSNGPLGYCKIPQDAIGKTIGRRIGSRIGSRK